MHNNCLLLNLKKKVYLNKRWEQGQNQCVLDLKFEFEFFIKKKKDTHYAIVSTCSKLTARSIFLVWMRNISKQPDSLGAPKCTYANTYTQTCIFKQVYIYIYISTIWDDVNKYILLHQCVSTACNTTMSIYVSMHTHMLIHLHISNFYQKIPCVQIHKYTHFRKIDHVMWLKKLKFRYQNPIAPARGLGYKLGFFVIKNAMQRQIFCKWEHSQHMINSSQTFTFACVLMPCVYTYTWVMHICRGLYEYIYKI